jgi:hypothetical protein
VSEHRRPGAYALDRLIAAIRGLVAWLARRRKAVLAFVLPGLTLLAPTLLRGDLPTAAEWRIAAVTCVVTAIGVERISNAQKPKG